MGMGRPEPSRDHARPPQSRAVRAQGFQHLLCLHPQSNADGVTRWCTAAEGFGGWSHHARMVPSPAGLKRGWECSPSFAGPLRLLG